MIKKILLSIVLVSFGLVVISLNVLLLTEAGLRACILLADRFAPGTLSVETVTGRLASRFVLERVRYSGDSGDVSLGHVSFSWKPLSLLHREVDIRSLLVRDVSLSMISQAEPPGSITKTKTPVSTFSLPIAFNLEQGQIKNLSIRSDKNEQVTKVSLLTLEKLSARETLIQVGNFALTSEMFHIGIQGQVQTTDTFPTRLQFSYAVESEDFLSVAGTGALEGTLKELVYTIKLNSPVVGSASGVIVDVAGNTRWTGILSSDSFSLAEINRAWPQLSFRDFQINGEGDLETYSLHAVTQATYDDVFQEIAVSATVQGDKSRLQLADIRMDKGEMGLHAEGQLAWEDVFAWQANLIGTNINPDLVDPRWPGRLDFAAVLAGHKEHDKYQGNIELLRLDGELRGYPLHATGKIIVDGNELSVDRFHMQSADSTLQVEGNIGDVMGMDFSFTSPRLETVWPDLSGFLEGKGRITGSRNNPDVQFDISGNSIAQGRTKIGSLVAQGTGSLSKQGPFNATVSAEELVVAETEIDAVEAALHGSFQEHIFEAEVTAPQGYAKFDFAGEYQENVWRGHFNKVYLQTEQKDEWQLQEPGPVILSSKNIDIGQFCFAGMESAIICVNGSYAKGDWNAYASIRSFPLSILQKIQDRFDEIGGLLSGTVSVQGKDGKLLSGKMEFSSDNVFTRQTLSEGYAPDIRWKKIVMSAAIDGQLLDMDLTGSMQDGSRISATGVVNGFNILPLNWENAGIDGKVAFNIIDLSPLANLSYPVVEPSGTLQGDMELHGKLKKPEVQGRITLDQGKLIFPEQGVAIENLAVSVQGHDNTINLNLTGTSGDGKISVEGMLYLDRLNDEYLTLHIVGENVEVVNLPEMMIKMSPDLQFKVHRDQGILQGKILLTEALIAPKELKGVVSASKDIVIVEEVGEENSASWTLETDIHVIAGDKVRVSAFGLRGFIDGRLHIISLPSRPVVFEGNLNVREGTYSIYGRQLNIVRGYLSYQGSSPDNPGVEVRAENTTSGVTTGIEVSGFLREPDVGFYSTPPMKEDEIIRRLLMNTSLVGSSEEDKGFLGSVASDTGIDPIATAIKDVKNSLRVDDIKIETGKESDDLSLVLGTWVTPKLYVSYGKNLLKESGSFNSKYMLGYGFFLETETGSTASGVDLMYEIGR